MARNKRHYLDTYYTRPESEMHRQLNRAIHRIGEVGVNKMDRKELKQVGLPIIREARARMRQLESHGLTDSPSYRYLKNLNIKVSTGGKDLNTIRHNVMEAYNFLHTKTSTVEGASEYSNWMDTHLGSGTSVEQRETIWDLVHRFEASHPQHFMNYGYDVAIQRISKAAREADFDIEVAYKNLADMFNSVDVPDTQDRERLSPWYKGRNSMSDF